MNELLIVLTPLIVLLILVLIRFTACGSFGTAETPESIGKVAGPPLTLDPVTPQTYAELVANTKGFAAHWPLDEAKGSLVAAVKGPLGAAAGVYVVADAPGLSLGEDGVLAEFGDHAPKFLDGGYVQVPFINVLNPGNTLAFSVELWVKPDPDFVGAGNTQVLISSHRVDVQRGYEILLDKRPNQTHQRLRARVYSSTAANLAEVEVQPLQGDPKEWRHVVMSYEGTPSGAGVLTLHVRLASAANTLQQSTSTAPGDYMTVTAANPATLRFGSSHRAGQDDGNFFAGQIDEVAFYNAALSQADRDAHFDMAV